MVVSRMPGKHIASDAHDPTWHIHIRRHINTYSGLLGQNAHECTCHCSSQNKCRVEVGASMLSTHDVTETHEVCFEMVHNTGLQCGPWDTSGNLIMRMSCWTNKNIVRNTWMHVLHYGCAEITHNIAYRQNVLTHASLCSSKNVSKNIAECQPKKNNCTKPSRPWPTNTCEKHTNATQNSCASPRSAA